MKPVDPTHVPLHPPGTIFFRCRAPRASKFSSGDRDLPKNRRKSKRKKYRNCLSVSSSGKAAKQQRASLLHDGYTLVSRSINTMMFADGACEGKSRSEEEVMQGHRRRRVTRKRVPRDRPQAPSARRVAAGRHRFLCRELDAVALARNVTVFYGTGHLVLTPPQPGLCIGSRHEAMRARRPDRWLARSGKPPALPYPTW